MKIYTKKGDKGETRLLYGDAVSKDSIAPEAYGSVDELVAALGLVRYEQKLPLETKSLKPLIPFFAKTSAASVLINLSIK